MARRRLDAELVRRKLATSRSNAQRAIAAGEVEVDGMTATKAASQVDEGASIRLAGPAQQYVSRGGHKLAAALDAFPIDVSGLDAADLGASTGGFTDCLLQRGARSVAAIDVGYGQLDWSLRQDPRVAVFERSNVRHIDVTDVGGPFDLIVADLSFISLRTVADAVAACGRDGANWVLLVKPQFEAGREQVGRGGIVKDPDLREATIRRVIDHYANLGLVAQGVVDSPIEGAKGNREFLVWLTRGEAPEPLDLSQLAGLSDA